MFVHLDGTERLLQHIQHWYYDLSHQDNVKLSQSSEEMVIVSSHLRGLKLKESKITYYFLNVALLRATNNFMSSEKFWNKHV